MLESTIIEGIASTLRHETAMQLSDIAEGTKKKELDRQYIFEEALKIKGMLTMREGLARLSQEENQEGSIIQLFKRVVSDVDNDGKKRLNLTEDSVDDKFLILLNISTNNVLKNAQHANPDAELMRKTKGNESLEVAEFAIFWKEETISLCQSASKMITRLKYLKSQFVSTLTIDQQHEHAVSIQSFADKTRELANGTLHSIAQTNLSRLVTKALKDPGMEDMFKELINLTPEVTFLMTHIKLKQGKESIEPVSRAGYLKYLSAQFENLKHKASVVITGSLNGKSWRGTALIIATKGVSLMEDLEHPEGIDEEQQAQQIEKIRDLVYLVGKMNTILRKQSNQASISKKTPKNDGSVRIRSNNLLHGQYALEQAKKKAKEAQANIQSQQKELVKVQQKKLEISDRLDRMIDEMEKASTTESDMCICRCIDKNSSHR